MKGVVVVFAKYPEPGFVKTRLAASIGDVEACRVYERMLSSLLARLRDRSYDLLTFLTPVDRAAEFRDRFGCPVEDQRGADLGERLHDCFVRMCARYRSVVIVGSDVPGLTSGRMEEAFDALSVCDVVLGPCPDGGYYLVAAKQPHDIFRGIAWGTSEVLWQTLRRAANLRLREALLPEEADIDNIEDLRRHESRGDHPGPQ